MLEHKEMLEDEKNYIIARSDIFFGKIVSIDGKKIDALFPLEFYPHFKGEICFFNTKTDYMEGFNGFISSNLGNGLFRVSLTAENSEELVKLSIGQRVMGQTYTWDLAEGWDDAIEVYTELDEITNPHIISLASVVLSTQYDYEDHDDLDLLIEHGESKTCEFKQTFNYDIKTKKPAKYLIDEVTQTLAGFLNTDGGKLLIGVSDNGDIFGIETELKKLHNNSQDKLKLRIQDAIKYRLGEELISDIGFAYKKHKGKEILIIDVKHTKRPPVWWDKKYIFIRGDPLTQKLEGKKAAEFCIRRVEDINLR